MVRFELSSFCYIELNLFETMKLVWPMFIQSNSHVDKRDQFSQIARSSPMSISGYLVVEA